MKPDELFIKLKQIKSLVDECLNELPSRTIQKVKKSQKKSADTTPSNSSTLNYSTPIRPFIKNNSKGMSGPKKFVLILAHLSRGDLKNPIKLSEIKNQWNKMTKLLGGKFNFFYTQQAKDSDWVETKTKGSYNLRPDWNEIFKS